MVDLIAIISISNLRPYTYTAVIEYVLPIAFRAGFWAFAAVFAASAAAGPAAGLGAASPAGGVGVEAGGVVFGG